MLLDRHLNATIYLYIHNKTEEPTTTECTIVARRPPIQVGDRFVKSGNHQTAVWIVAKIIQSPAEPPHARLTQEANDRETLTISLPTLADAHYFKRA